MLAKDGKLGVVLGNNQFTPLATPVEARAGDLVRVRLEQSGKETTIRVVRVISPAQSGSSVAAPVLPRTLRDLFPAETIKPLQDLFSSLRELLDEVGGSSGGGAQNLPGSDTGLHDLLGGLNAAAAPRLSRIPAAYGARSDELRGVAPSQNSSLPTLPDARPPGPSSLTPPATAPSPIIPAALPAAQPGTPAEALSGQILSMLVQQVLSRSRLPATLAEVALPQPSDNRPPQLAPSEGEKTGTNSPELRGSQAPKDQAGKLPSPLPGATRGPGSAAINAQGGESIIRGGVALAGGGTASDRFLRAATEAQPILEQYSRVFEAIHQPSYTVSALTIGGHVVPLQVAVTHEQPTHDPVDEEGGGSAPRARGYRRVRMSLTFPTLGPLGIDVAYRDVEVLLKFTVQNRDIAQFLEGELPKLAGELEEAGFSAVTWFTEKGAVAEVVPGWFREMVEGGVVV